MKVFLGIVWLFIFFAACFARMGGVTPEETVMIGDRIYTDVKSGLNAGVLSILVMSGETDEAILEASPDKPDAVMADCSEILEILKSEAK